MKMNLDRLLSFVFVFFVLLIIVVFNLEKPRVMILHSYDTDYSWVRDINVGLNRILKNHSVKIRYYYMNTKRNPDKEYKERIGAAATKVVKEWKPDVLIAIDDDAQKYVASNFINDPYIKIVFSGVNAKPEIYNYDKAKNVTGIIERLPFESFKEVFLQILPKDKRKVMHIADASSTSIFIQKEIEALDWSPLELEETILCETLVDWKKAIKRASEEADILFITHYHTIKDEKGLVIQPKKIIEMTEPYLKIPAIGSWGFYVEDGGMMAVAVSPYEQGEEAAKMALQIIDYGVKPSDIPFKKNSLFVVYIREKNIKRRNLKIPGLIEAFAKATNNYYEEKK